MIDSNLREYLSNIESPNPIIMLEKPSFDMSVIGLSCDYKVIYSYNKMILEYCNTNDNYDTDAAIDFLNTQTIPFLLSIDQSIRPVIIYDDIKDLIDE